MKAITDQLAQFSLGGCRRRAWLVCTRCFFANADISVGTGEYGLFDLRIKSKAAIIVSDADALARAEQELQLEHDASPWLRGERATNTSGRRQGRNDVSDEG
ncbi:hypothetical protein GQ600_6385 [Phytophthora cactorum]|nr:hypothetical protein GQ600_6385 [Phytophthora cactorum]